MNKLLIIAGEDSGELHGSALMKEILKLNPEITFYGIGGERMIAEGLKSIFHTKDMSFLGFSEVVKHLPFIYKVKRKLMQIVRDEQIRTAVLIDYPGFNLNVAKKLKGLGVKIFYYVSPQIWAWGKHRVKSIKKLIHKMIVVFPFEKDFYQANEIDTEFVGHPLITRIRDYDYMSKEELYDKFNLVKTKDIILLMPGSRLHEIEKIFPECFSAAERLAEHFNLQVVVACAQNISEDYFEKLVDKKINVIKNNSYDLMKHAKFGIIKSGTSTLEAALHELPFAAVYSTSRLTYLIGKKLVNIDNIAMPNIVAGKRIVEEFIQDDLSADKIFRYAKTVLESEKKIENIKSDLLGVKTKLGNNNAPARAAKLILKEMNEAKKK